jgi:hypothetical protein
MKNRRSLPLILIGIVAISGLACGFLDSEAATVTYEEAIPIIFSVSAGQLCPPDADCEAPAQPAPQDIELLAIELTVPIDLVEATGNEELRSISSRMRSMEITSIDYVVSDNDLTFDLPEIEIHVAPPNVDDPSASTSVHLTTLPVIPAGSDVTTNAPVRDAAVEPASDLFKELHFNALGNGTPTVAEGQPFPPSGAADLEMTVNIRIVANPIDSL